MDKLLKLIENDCKMTTEELSMLCEMSDEEINKKIAEYQEKGIILGYKAVVDWDKTDTEYVTAMIELKVIPARDRGFDKVAEKICNYPEVKSVYLMSGGMDIIVLVEGKTMKEVAYFVARKLAAIDDVTSTATHFVMRKFMDNGIVFGSEKKDERGNAI